MLSTNTPRPALHRRGAHGCNNKGKQAPVGQTHTECPGLVRGRSHVCNAVAHTHGWRVTARHPSSGGGSGGGSIVGRDHAKACVHRGVGCCLQRVRVGDNAAEPQHRFQPRGAFLGAWQRGWHRHAGNHGFAVSSWTVAAEKLRGNPGRPTYETGVTAVETGAEVDKFVEKTRGVQQLLGGMAICHDSASGRLSMGGPSIRYLQGAMRANGRATVCVPIGRKETLPHPKTKTKPASDPRHPRRPRIRSHGRAGLTTSPAM